MKNRVTYYPPATQRRLATNAEQLLHDQIEFTPLSTFLADIHAEFS